MGYFPVCMDLSGAKVLLIGSGPQIREKTERLGPFGARLRRMDAVDVQALADAALVIVGDTDWEESARISTLCRERHIPVNVVDRPELCSFFFPSLITRGDLTVSVSTGGKSPAAAVYLRQQIERQLPDRTGEILDWLQELRSRLRTVFPPEQYREILKAAACRAFALGRPLQADEWNAIE